MEIVMYAEANAFQISITMWCVQREMSKRNLKCIVYQQLISENCNMN